MPGMVNTHAVVLVLCTMCIMLSVIGGCKNSGRSSHNGNFAVEKEDKDSNENADDSIFNDENSTKASSDNNTTSIERLGDLSIQTTQPTVRRRPGTQPLNQGSEGGSTAATREGDFNPKQKQPSPKRPPKKGRRIKRSEQTNYEGNELPDKEQRRISQYGELLDNLKGRPAAEYKISPFDYSDTNKAITIIFSPFKILSVDEREQSLTVSSYLIIKWHDDSLRWPPKDFHGINHIAIRTQDIWTPDILVPRANGDGFRMPKPEYAQLRAESFSNVRVATLFKFTISCDLDMALYPFDTQKCPIIFVDEQDRPLRAKDNSDTEDNVEDYFGTSGEWEITDKCLDQFNDRNVSDFFFKHPLQFTVTMQRRSAFYIANLLVPVYITSFIALFVFWIPPETGEKISFMVSIYVSTAMYISIINDVLPRSLSSLPAFNIVIVLVNIEIGLTFIATLIVLRVYRKHLEMEKYNEKINTNSSNTNNHLSALGATNNDALLMSFRAAQMQQDSPRYKHPLTPDIFKIRKRMSGKVDSVNSVNSSVSTSRVDFVADSLSTGGDGDGASQGGPNVIQRFYDWMDYRRMDKAFFVAFTICYFMSLFVPWFVKLP